MCGASAEQPTDGDPNEKDAIRELGRTLANTGDYKGAIEQFKAYLQAKPDAKDAAEVQSWIKALEPLVTK